MFASFQKKYFLSDKGVAGVKRGIFWTAITNLVTMGGMGFLFLTMACFVEHLATGEALPAEERQTSFTQMMEVALETAVKLEK